MRANCVFHWYRLTSGRIWASQHRHRTSRCNERPDV